LKAAHEALVRHARCADLMLDTTFRCARCLFDTAPIRSAACWSATWACVDTH